MKLFIYGTLKKRISQSRKTSKMIKSIENFYNKNGSCYCLINHNFYNINFVLNCLKSNELIVVHDGAQPPKVYKTLTQKQFIKKIRLLITYENMWETKQFGSKKNIVYMSESEFRSFI